MSAPTSARTSKSQLDNIKKVAVTMPGQQALFMELDQNRPLAAVIQDICDKWTLSSPEDYAVQFSEPNRQAYITEHTRADIQNGNVLQLTSSPGKRAQNIIEKLQDGKPSDKLEALKELSSLSGDATFAMEFINKQGLNLINKFVTSGTFQGEPLAFTLKSFVALMDHSVVSWDILDSEFIRQISSCLSGRYSICLQPALEILENVILHSSESKKHSVLEQAVTPSSVIPYLQSTNPDVQKSAIALINAMFTKAEQENRKKIAESLQSKNFRTIISNHILNSSVGQEMAHQLYVLQTLLLNLHELRMKTLPDQHNEQNVMKQIEELRRIAFDFTDAGRDPNATPSRKSAVGKDFKKLGFLHQENPLKDFSQVPPGLLAVDNMMYFAQVHKENYIRVVLENSGRADEHDCPFVQASIRLTNLLCQFLKIGDQPWEEESSYYPMFFSVDKPFEEFFCTCITLLNKTWRDMRASSEDFPKVLNVVKEQITRALDRHQMPKTFDMFKSKLSNFAYAEIKKIWDAERQNKDESQAQAKPIQALRKQILPEVTDLIRQQRLSFLEEGIKTPKYDNKGSKIKNKYQYWKLSLNNKALHYGDCSETAEPPSIDQLQSKVSVLEMKSLLVGKECPHVKDKVKRPQQEIAFSLVCENNSSDPNEQEIMHHLLANSDEELDIWVDGINALLGNKMTSKKATIDEDTLMNMEIKLRLLDTEGITIPNNPPAIPPAPADLNFAYHGIN